MRSIAYFVLFKEIAKAQEEIICTLSTNVEILWITTGIIAFALAFCIGLDLTELKSNATSGAIATEVFADVWKRTVNRVPNMLCTKEMCSERNSNAKTSDHCLCRQSPCHPVFLAD